MHRREQSANDALQPPKASPLEAQFTNIMPVGNFSRNNPGALGELQHNQQEPAPRPSPRKSRDERRPDPEPAGRSDSPTKKSLFLSMTKSRDSSPTKSPKKAKSGANLTNLLGRQKTIKSLHKLVTDGDEIQSGKDKENRTPDEPHSATLPVYAQFANNESMNSLGPPSPTRSTRNSSERRSVAKDRPPRSFMYPTRSQQDIKKSSIKSDSPSGSKSASSKGKSIRERGKVFGAFASFGHGRSKSETSTPRGGSPTTAGHVLDLKDINKQLEALLDRRNIPENQRYKMRNLSETIKMEFIRQDRAEMRAAKLERKPDRPRTSLSNSMNGAAVASASTSAVVSDAEEEKPKRNRGRSFTFSRAKKDKEQQQGRSSSKKSTKGESTMSRHFRNKSTDSVTSDHRPVSSGNSSAGSTLLSKIKLQQGPADYVAYLRKVRQPQQVEVGKLHKLRLLLRNETVAWIEEFIQHGGMKEIVGLLNRIMGVEWR